MSSANYTSAKKIICLDDNKKIYSDAETLQKLLQHPDVKDKPVCVVSITGTFRQGKSFMLNFLLLYLNAKYGKKIAFTTNWISLAGNNISGFEWRGGQDRHTTGILMWPEIFVARLPSGENVSIVLLDTQGTFDNKTSKQQCAAVFAISTLISSVQIYNVKSQINQADLEHLECFSGFGQLVANHNSSARAFQNLWFLIRDWQYPYENSYGIEGGRKYLEKFLNSPEQPEDLKKQNENIQSLFTNLNCCLLPHPGESVATDPTFRGDLRQVSKAFLTQVEEFVPKILAPEHLLPKMISGVKIKTGDLVRFIQTYCQHFMDENVPQLKSMYLATCVAHLDVMLAEAEALYESSMVAETSNSQGYNESFIHSKHKEKMGEAKDHFCKKSAMGEREMKKSYEEKLVQKLEKKLSEYLKINTIKLENAKAREKFDEEVRKERRKHEEEFAQMKLKHDMDLMKQKVEILEIEKKKAEENARIRNKEEEEKDTPGAQFVDGVKNLGKGSAQVLVGGVKAMNPYYWFK